MKNTLSLFLLLLTFSSVKGQGLESIPGDSVLKSPVGSFSISCKAVGYDFGSYAMHWIRQPPGKGLQWIGRIFTNTGDTAYANGLEGRIEITKDNSKGMSHLKLSGLTAEDTAVYYCARLTQCGKQMGRMYKNLSAAEHTHHAGSSVSALSMK
ncbi:hypothetical protein NFI96_024133 [Prochilodus magdalenae]|nr:hypothetical protein NFI96_024133 [Prochilodus magdalenae]